MQKIDFNQAFDAEEFEDFGCDVVAVRENLNIERFKKFKDRGFDGRYIDDDEKIMIQCKRISDEDNLYEKLKNIEIMKVQKFCPDRYILVLSIDLTIGKKDEILALFGDYIKNKNDLIMPADIKEYFRTDKKYDYLRKRYYSLFLAKNVDLLDLLEEISNSNVKNRTKELFLDVSKLKNYFVATDIYKESLDMILKERVICLTGDPGSGKTTSGKMIADYLFRNDFVDSVYSVKSMSEIDAVFERDKRQVLFFDDFWGSTFSSKSYLNCDDRELNDIIEKIEHSQSYLILTTREYVLEQGMQYHREFNTARINKRIFYKNCDYSDEEKVRILYSRFAYSEVSYKVLDDLYLHAKDIIQYANYSPRVVDFFLTKKQSEFGNADEFYGEFEEFLCSPFDYLDTIFRKLSEGARIIAYILSISDPEVEIDFLKKSFLGVVKCLKNGEVKASKFLEYLKELLDWFVEFFEDNLFFVNHSIQDFVDEEFIKEFVDYEDAFVEGVLYFNQFYNLILRDDFDISKKGFKKLCERFRDEFDDLVIIHDEDGDVFWYINEEPVYYLHHKIWQTIKLYEKRRVEVLREIILKKMNRLFDYDVASLGENLVHTSELVKRAESCGIFFDCLEVIRNYFALCKNLRDYAYSSLFPNSYHKEIKRVWLSEVNYDEDELVLSFFRTIEELEDKEDWDIEVEIFAEMLPNFFKIVGVSYTGKLKETVDEYIDEPEQKQESKNNGNHLIKEVKNEYIDDVIWECDEKINQVSEFEEFRFFELLEESSLKEESKKKLLKAFKERTGLFKLGWNWEENFGRFLVQYYEFQENLGLGINVERSEYLKILSYLEEVFGKGHVEFLMSYALESIMEDFDYYSVSYILKNYEVEKRVIDELLEVGLLVCSRNVIKFGDVLIQIFFSAVFIKDYEISESFDYNYYLKPSSIYLEDVYTINEEFNTKSFNSKVLIPILEDEVLSGVETFIRSYSNVNIEKTGESYYYTDLFNPHILLAFIEAFLGRNMLDEIGTVCRKGGIPKNKKYLRQGEFIVGLFLENHNPQSHKKYEEIRGIYEDIFEQLKIIYVSLSINDEINYFLR